MNDPQPQPDLTAYALGELDHANDAAVHAWLREHPDAQHEVDTISDLAHAMQAAAPLHSLRLHPAQRHAVLSGPERVREMVATASRRARETSRKPILLRLIEGGVKTGLAASIVVTAFVAGKHYQVTPPTNIVSVTPPTSVTLTPEVQPETPAPEVPQTADRIVISKVPEPAVQPPASVVATATPAPAVVKAPPPTEAVVAEVKLPAEPNEQGTRRPEAICRISNVAVASTAQTPTTQFSIAPGETRPRVESGRGFASPATSRKGALEKSAKTKAPTLLIHSWRAEVTSSPWDNSKKLVRISLQIPGEQAAAAADHHYGLQVNFHPTHIRSYRMIGQRAVPAAEKDGAATFSAWYEVTLNGAPGGNTARNIGNVTLSNARFTVTALAPFDVSRLQLVDHGHPWHSAADDFVFESAVLGWGMLLHGKNLPTGLDLQSILDLAEHAQKTADRHGERAKFIKLLQDARRAAGA